jgi:hypothetical protein
VRPAAAAALAQGRGPIVVCLLRMRGGTEHAFGTEAAEITRRAGPSIQVSPGLVIDEMESTIDPFALSGETALTQAQVSVVLPDSLAAMQGDWRYVGAASAEVARVWPGEAWEDRESMLAGTRLSGVTIGVAGAPSTFTVEAAQAKTSATLGAASRTIGADVPTPQDQSGADLTDLSGVEYPMVWGKPYRSQAFKIGEIGGDGYDRLVIGHEAWPASVTTVGVYEDGVSVGSYSVLSGSASSGAYAYVRANPASVFDAGRGAFTIAPTVGSSPGPNGADPALTMGDLLELWLQLSGLTVDWQRTRPAIQRLQTWPVGVYLDKETPAIQAIRDHIASVAPLIELQSADGVWFYYADMSTPTIRGVLTEGQELIGAVGGVSLTELEDVVNSVTVRYALDEATGEYTGAETVDADTDAAAYVSAQLYGTLAAEAIDTTSVQDASTARRVGRALIQRRAYQRRRMTWLVSDYADIQAGEVYRVEAPTFGISRNAVATTVRGVVGRQVTFTVLDGPL